MLSKQSFQNRFFAKREKDLVTYVLHTRVKMNCVNCGDQIGNERNSDDKFCSDQCKVEYELEHNRK